MLDADALLDICQRGAGSDALSRAGLLGRYAAGEDARRLPLGELDRRIWAMRAAFRAESGLSANVAAVATCPECQARLEFELPTDFVIPEASADHARIDWEGKRHRLRMPSLADFDEGGLRVGRLGDGPWRDGGFVEQAAAALQQADPALDLRLALHCPDCGGAFDLCFDPPAFFAELAETGRQLLAEVVRLARAFGWSERDILAMPPRRRALYLAELG